MLYDLLTFDTTIKMTTITYYEYNYFKFSEPDLES